MADSRLQPRLPISLAVTYRTAGAFLVSYSTNLSKGGIFVETEQPNSIGERVSLRFEVPDAGEIFIDGVVTWVRTPGEANGGLPSGMGIRFERIDEKYGEVIDRMVRDFVGLSVLIMAASSDRLALLGRYIRSIIGCEIIEATTPEVAEVALETTPPDLVVVDLDRATDMGMRTVRAAKSARPAPPVIILASDELARKDGVDAGADQVLATPPSYHELHAAVIRTLSRPLVR